MKILLCTNHFAPLIGGSEVVTGKIADYLSPRGHEICIATRRVQSRNPSQFKNLKFIEYSPGDFKKFSIATSDFKPDVVFIYSDVFDFTRHILAEFPHRLIIALCGANWLYNNKNYVRHVYRHKNLTNLICHSKLDRDYKLCFNSELLKKTTVIPNGIDISEFNITTSRDLLLKEMSLPSEYMKSKWILNVSNFFPGKGQHHIPSILNKMPEKWEYVYFQVASDIDFPIGAQLEASWNKECSIKLKHSPNVKVHLIKNQPREKVISFFKNSNLFLFTSEKEVAPIVLLESMAAELPWISTNVGNSAELNGGKVVNTIKDGRFHSVIDERAKLLLAKGAAELLSKPSLAAAGRLQAEKLGWERILPLYASLIEK